MPVLRFGAVLGAGTRLSARPASRPHPADTRPARTTQHPGRDSTAPHPVYDATDMHKQQPLAARSGKFDSATRSKPGSARSSRAICRASVGADTPTTKTRFSTNFAGQWMSTHRHGDDTRPQARARPRRRTPRATTRTRALMANPSQPRHTPRSRDQAAPSRPRGEGQDVRRYPPPKATRWRDVAPGGMGTVRTGGKPGWARLRKQALDRDGHHNARS